MGKVADLIQKYKEVRSEREALKKEFEKNLPVEFREWWEGQGEWLVKEILLKTGMVMNNPYTEWDARGRFGFCSLEELKKAFKEKLQPAWQELCRIEISELRKTLYVRFVAV